MASNAPWEWTQLKTEYGFLESFDESRASCQGQGVSAGRARRHSGTVRPKKKKQPQTKQPPKNKLNISSSGLMGGAGRESNLNPVKALV